MVHRISLWFSVALGALLLVHLAYPPFAIDTGSLGLLVLLIVVLILPYSKAVRFPGGGGIDLDLPETEKAVQKAEARPGPRTFRAVLSDTVTVGAGVGAAGGRALGRSWHAYFAEDPNLGLAALRMEIERLLREIADRAGIGDEWKHRGAVQLATLLQAKEALSADETDAIVRVLRICNQAVHGEEVSGAAAEIVLDLGDRIIGILSSKLV